MATRSTKYEYQGMQVIVLFLLRKKGSNCASLKIIVDII